MSWRVDEAESWEGRPMWRAIFSEEVASMLLYLPSAGCVRGLRKPGCGRREGTVGRRELIAWLRVVF